MRTLVQALAALAQNGYLASAWTRNLYQGRGKLFCTPGLNCHSCPAALFSCPIGTLQHFMSGAKGAFRWASYQLGFLVAGFLIAFGVLFGRAACGWLCPFGFLQELLHRASLPKFTIPRTFSHLRYPVLALAVLILPVALSTSLIGGDPWFCKFLCPAGTLESGGLLFIMPELREQLGGEFLFKAGLLAATLSLALFTYRPYCKTLCPLGLIYGFFNRVSFFGVNYDTVACKDCRACVAACKSSLDPRVADADPACLRCLDCARKVCPNGALTVRLAGRKPSGVFPPQPLPPAAQGRTDRA